MTTPTGPDTPEPEKPAPPKSEKPATPKSDNNPAAPAQPGRDASVDEVESDLGHTREDLGNTIDALSEKFDAKAQAQHALHDARDRATQQAQAVRVCGDQVFASVKDAATDDQGSLKPAVPVAAALLAVVVVALRISKRRRR